MKNEVIKDEIDIMISTRVAVLVKYLVDNKKTLNESEAKEMLENTKTYKYLLNNESNFYWKSVENLVYLLIMEQEGNEDEWNRNA